MVVEYVLGLVQILVAPIITAVIGWVGYKLQDRIGIEINEKNRQALEDVLSRGISGTIQTYTKHIKKNRVDGILSENEKKEARDKAFKFAVNFAEKEGSKKVLEWLKDPETKEWIEESAEAAYSKIKSTYEIKVGNSKWEEAIKPGIFVIWNKIADEASANLKSNKYELNDWKPLIKMVKVASSEFLSQETRKYLGAIRQTEGIEAINHEDAIDRLIFKQLILATRDHLNGS